MPDIYYLVSSYLPFNAKYVNVYPKNRAPIIRARKISPNAVLFPEEHFPEERDPIRRGSGLAPIRSGPRAKKHSDSNGYASFVCFMLCASFFGSPFSVEACLLVNFSAHGAPQITPSLRLSGMS